MKKKNLIVISAILSVVSPCLAAQAKKTAKPAKVAKSSKGPSSRGSRFQSVDAAIEDVIAKGQIPGAVLVVGHEGKVIYRKAYGHRALVPSQEPMTTDTIFDIASLTKCVATATSVTRMLELGQLRLNDTIGKFIPEFATNGKQEITIRELMTHFSGLGPDLDLRQPWTGRETAFNMIAAEKPVNPPGSRFLYSDINFEILGFIVEKVSNLTLDKYASIHVFQPLKMKHTSYLPPESWNKKIAPTQYDEHNVILRGVVHDPTARRMGGVAGHAGVFSTADDLALFAQAMLDGNKILTKASIQKMTTPEQPPTSTDLRGLGWDLDTPFSSNRGELLPIGSYGHTGFTGTSLWIDPFSQTYVILLSNAVHPNGPLPGGIVVSLRTRVMDGVTSALKLHVDSATANKIASITGYNEAAVGSHRPVARNGKVLNGIDVLEAENFAQLKQGRDVTRIGILTNQNGVDLDSKRTIDVLNSAQGIKVVRLFAPEHGLSVAHDSNDLHDAVDEATKLPIVDVYGDANARKPSQDALKDLDAIVVDLQDVGGRYWTYDATVGNFMESAAKAGIQVFVLDHPNPVGGVLVQGPVSDIKQSFVNYYAAPTRHGMTIGELATMYNAELHLNAKLSVVKMQGWQRGDWFDSTGQEWMNPSPNMRNLLEATLYTGVGIIEYTNVSVGRGTDTPFEIVGAPWIHGRELADYLNQRNIAGVRFVATTFTPDNRLENSKFVNQKCGGINIVVLDRYALDAPQVGIEIASALIHLYPTDYKPGRIIELLGNNAAFDALKAGTDPRRIADDWRDGIATFEQTRRKYLLYK
jgi:uncharacterized protein YbbC (DUF1343 family)/CubicO group peptidase (beta-lactamase class C family)